MRKGENENGYFLFEICAFNFCKGEWDRKMTEICPNCGLPKDICACETIAKEEEKIRISSVKKRFGKRVTVIEGISKDVNSKGILKELKTKFACGGTMKNNVIELQGDHRKRIKELLVKLGFPGDKIEVS
jgi:translation initiation factor 1